MFSCWCEIVNNCVRNVQETNIEFIYKLPIKTKLTPVLQLTYRYHHVGLSNACCDCNAARE